MWAIPPNPPLKKGGVAAIPSGFPLRKGGVRPKPLENPSEERKALGYRISPPITRQSSLITRPARLIPRHLSFPSVRRLRITDRGSRTIPPNPPLKKGGVATIPPGSPLENGGEGRHFLENHPARPKVLPGPIFPPVTRPPSLFTRHSSLFTRHSSLITRLSSLITRLSSLITRHSSLITRHSSLITRHSSLITRHSSLITLHPSLIPRAAKSPCGWW